MGKGSAFGTFRLILPVNTKGGAGIHSGPERQKQLAGGTAPVIHYSWQAQGLSLSCDALTMACAHGRSQGTEEEVCDGHGMDPTWAAPITGCVPSTSVKPGSQEGLYLEKQPAMGEWHLRTPPSCLS
ncbi:hypothetical protein A6R68_10875 [Neotoma lepida]|uniref:Uncharacterized protein n=1 Tax=Neotoma lepida TaxID=56216 RepID=A0A1A6FVL4_NEOLE|nr:hypothetical protein A6R68_10875 [Neotoma lepida]